MISAIRTRSQRIARACLTLVAVFVLTVGAAGCPPQDLSDQAVGQILKLNAYKAKAEAGIRRVDEARKGDQQVMKRVEFLYSENRAEWNAWISTLQFLLSSNQDPDKSETLKAAATKAAATSDAFMAEVEKLAKSEAAASAVVKELLDIGVAIYRVWSAERAAARKLIVDELEKQKWPAFKDLKTA